MASKPAASGSLTLTLEVIREMLNLRNTYSQLDAENGNSSSALTVRHQANSVNHRSGNGDDKTHAPGTRLSHGPWSRGEKGSLHYM